MFRYVHGFVWYRFDEKGEDGDGVSFAKLPRNQLHQTHILHEQSQPTRTRCVSLTIINLLSINSRFYSEQRLFWLPNSQAMAGFDIETAV